MDVSLPRLRQVSHHQRRNDLGLQLFHRTHRGPAFSPSLVGIGEGLKHQGRLLVVATADMQPQGRLDTGTKLFDVGFFERRFPGFLFRLDLFAINVQLALQSL